MVRDVDGTLPRRAWVTWQEGGRLPDVIVELLSGSTRGVDLGLKKELYERVFRTAEYFCYGPDPLEGEPELVGWVLWSGRYEALGVDGRGWLWSEQMGAWLGAWEGAYHGVRSRWLRLYDVGGRLVPTEAEAERARADAAEAQLEVERMRVEAERTRAETAEAQAEAERRRAEAAEAQAAAERERATALEAELRRLRSLLEQRNG